MKNIKILQTFPNWTKPANCKALLNCFSSLIYPLVLNYPKENIEIEQLSHKIESAHNIPHFKKQ